MGKILVKSVELRGSVAMPVDKYRDTGNDPCDIDVERTYHRIDEMLHRMGELIVPQTAQNMPFLVDGFMTQSPTISCYSLADCLVANIFHPQPYRATNLLRVASSLENEVIIDTTLKLLKIAAGEFINYWGNEKREIVDISERLKGNKSLPSSLQKLLRA